MRSIYAMFMLSLLFLLIGCVQSNSGLDPTKFWQDGYCRQSCTRTQEEGAEVVKAKIEGKWKEFKLVEFHQEFMDWNLSRRMETIKLFQAMMKGDKNVQGPELAGPHNGIVATYGFKRDDTNFSLNNAVKGMGFLPKRERIVDVIKMLEESLEAPMPVRLEKLEFLYQNADSIFAFDKQISLELYSKPEFMTQTFLNQMVNPVSTIVFLDIPSFKLKTITRLLHPDDPELSDYEKNIVNYINLMHSFFHGRFSKDFIAVIYYVVEIYDNSPMGQDPESGMGRRVVPALP